MSIADGIKSLTLDGLLERLHAALKGFAKDMDEVIGENESVSSDDLSELREHIRQRLDRNEEITDNEKLLKLLNLFATDREVLEIVREDAEEWIALLESIEERIKSSPGKPTQEEESDLAEIRRLSGEIKALIRKD